MRPQERLHTGKEKDIEMLPQSFFDWWFAPWAYAVEIRGRLPLETDHLGRRDGYRLWCREAQVVADLPQCFDPGWHVAASTGGDELLASARLFGGLIAAREHNGPVLAELAFDDRKWCASIAATQPLRGCAEAGIAPTDTIVVRGLLELALRLEHGFSGMWARLRLGLPVEIAERVDALLRTVHVDDLAPDGTALRAQRCWTLCRRRAERMGAQPSMYAPRQASHVDSAMMT